LKIPGAILELKEDLSKVKNQLDKGEIPEALWPVMREGYEAMLKADPGYTKSFEQYAENHIQQFTDYLTGLIGQTEAGRLPE